MSKTITIREFPLQKLKKWNRTCRERLQGEIDHEIEVLNQTDLDSDMKDVLISRKVRDLRNMEVHQKRTEKTKMNEIRREAEEKQQCVLDDLDQHQYGLRVNGASSWRYDEDRGWYRAQEKVLEGIDETFLTFLKASKISSVLHRQAQLFVNDVLVKWLEDDPDITDQHILEGYYIYFMRSLLGEDVRKKKLLGGVR